MKRMFHKAQPSFVSLRTINNRYGKPTAKITVTETKDGFNPSKYENLLILETVYRSRNTTYPVHEITATERVDRHHGSIAQKSSELYRIPYRFPHYGNDAHGRRFLVHHAYCGFVCNDARNRRGGRIARNGNHVQPDRANASHGLQLFQSQRATLHGINHALVFTHRNKGSAQPSHV